MNNKESASIFFRMGGAGRNFFINSFGYLFGISSLGKICDKNIHDQVDSKIIA